MTELFLKKDGGDWQQVYFSTSGSGFKLTRENPYFTESESYTLDVSLPMDILDNRRFFGNLQRIDTTKKSTKYQCRLMVGNKSMLDGTARVSQVTQDTVKVQLLGGNSELNFLSKESGAYIDEMDLGYTKYFAWWYDYKGNEVPGALDNIVTLMPAYDETNGRTVNEKLYDKEAELWRYVASDMKEHFSAPQPNLLYILRAVLFRSGYTLVNCDIDREPWNRLFIASAKHTLMLSHALPHWRVGEFLSEVCKFFNCTLSVDSNAKTASVISNVAFFRDAKKMVIAPVDEYNSEMDDSDSAKALASSNLKYDMSSSPEHVYDILSDNLREAIPQKTGYSDRADALFDYNTLAENERMRYIFVTPTGKYFGWKDKDGENPLSLFTQVDHFSPLVRDAENDSSMSLKICPVAMMYSNDALYYDKFDGPRMSCNVASMENPSGNEADSGGDDTVSAQDLIEGNETLDKDGKEDRLQVFFIGGKKQSSDVQAGDDKGKSIPCLMPFTDCRYLASWTDGYDPWSLSLNPSEATHYLGQLHNTGFSFNVKAKHTFKFLASTMPDPTSVFQIRGKLYGCEKIEAYVTEEGFDKLMTGYFYEML